MADPAQHPPQPGGVDPAGVVVGHDEVVVAEPPAGQQGGEGAGLGQGVAARPGGPGQVAVDVEVDGPRQVAGGVLGPVAARLTHVPAHVGEAQPGVAPAGGQVGGGDQRRLSHRGAPPGTAPAPAAGTRAPGAAAASQGRASTCQARARDTTGTARSVCTARRL